MDVEGGVVAASLACGMSVSMSTSSWSTVSCGCIPPEGGSCGSSGRWAGGGRGVDGAGVLRAPFLDDRPGKSGTNTVTSVNSTKSGLRAAGVDGGAAVVLVVVVVLGSAGGA